MEAKQHLGHHDARHARTAEVLLWLAIIAASVTAVALFSALLAFCSPASRPAALPRNPQAGTVGSQNTRTASDTHPKNKNGFWGGSLAATAPANVSAGATGWRDSRFVNVQSEVHSSNNGRRRRNGGVILPPGGLDQTSSRKASPGPQKLSACDLPYRIERSQGINPEPSRPSLRGSTSTFLGEMGTGAKGRSFVRKEE